MLSIMAFHGLVGQQIEFIFLFKPIEKHLKDFKQRSNIIWCCKKNRLVRSRSGSNKTKREATSDIGWGGHGVRNDQWGRWPGSLINRICRWIRWRGVRKIEEIIHHINRVPACASHCSSCGIHQQSEQTKIPSIVEHALKRDHWLEQLTNRMVIHFSRLRKAEEERGVEGNWKFHFGHLKLPTRHPKENSDSELTVDYQKRSLRNIYELRSNQHINGI